MRRTTASTRLPLHRRATVAHGVHQGHDVAPVHGVQLQPADGGQHVVIQQALIFGPRAFVGLGVSLDELGGELGHGRHAPGLRLGLLGGGAGVVALPQRGGVAGGHVARLGQRQGFGIAQRENADLAGKLVSVDE